MTDIRPTMKTIVYDTLVAEVNFRERLMTITNKSSGDSISIPADAYGELQAIMTEVGRQSPGTPVRR